VTTRTQKSRKPDAERGTVAPHHEPTGDSAVATLDIGSRLKAIRMSYGLSIRALAEAAGVTHSTIAQIELNKVSPSVSSVKRILNVFNMPLSDFFAEVEDRQEERIFFKADELVELADGKMLSYRQVGSNLAGKAMMMLHERYAPGADTGEPYVHDAEECGIVIKGRVVIVVGQREQVLEAGEAYYFNSRLPHRMYNPFKETCEVISAVSPPTF
jgi:transcriptional regulator with XRE-family HTH domain